MENIDWIAPNTAPDSRHGQARARRLLLEQLRQAIAMEPAALEVAPHLHANPSPPCGVRMSYS